MNIQRPELVRTLLNEIGLKPVKRQNLTKEELQEILLTIRTLKSNQERLIEAKAILHDKLKKEQ